VLVLLVLILWCLLPRLSAAGQGNACWCHGCSCV
jgi:hypothetical protein